MRAVISLWSRGVSTGEIGGNLEAALVYEIHSQKELEDKRMVSTWIAMSGREGALRAFDFFFGKKSSNVTSADKLAMSWTMNVPDGLLSK